MGNPAHGETHGQDGEEPGSEGSAAQEGELTAVDFLYASVVFDTRAVRLARETEAELMPSSDCSFFSTLAEHTLQAMPITGIVFFIIFHF